MGDPALNDTTDKCQKCEDKIRADVIAERVSRRLCLICTQNPMPPGVTYSMKKERDAVSRAEVEGEVPYGYFKYSLPLAAIVQKNPEHWKMAKTYKHGSLYLFGPRGTGKSSWARYSLCKTIMAGYGVCDLLVGDIEAKRMWTWPNSAIAERAKFANRTLLDDIDNILAPSSAGMNVLRGIVDYRHEHGLDTIITSNSSLDEYYTYLKDSCRVPEKWAASFLDRFPTTEIEFNGTSYRREVAGPEMGKVAE